VNDHPQHVDLVTLEEVQRLLRDTEFATADDLRASVSPTDLARVVDAAPAPASRVEPAGADALAPLPRRR
jgi:hypothetical protein